MQTNQSLFKLLTPGNLQATITDINNRIKHIEATREDLAGQRDEMTERLKRTTSERIEEHKKSIIELENLRESHIIDFSKNYQEDTKDLELELKELMETRRMFSRWLELPTEDVTPSPLKDSDPPKDEESMGETTPTKKRERTSKSDLQLSDKKNQAISDELEITEDDRILLWLAIEQLVSHGKNGSRDVKLYNSSTIPRYKFEKKSKTELWLRRESHEESHMKFTPTAWFIGDKMITSSDDGILRNMDLLSRALSAKKTVLMGEEGIAKIILKLEKFTDAIQGK